MKIESKYLGGPYGDEMCSYKILVDGRCTIEDFITNCVNLEVNPSRGRFGSIYMNSTLLAKYRGTEITYNIECDDVLQVCKKWHPKEIKASGGWGVMDYHLYCF